LAADMDLPQPLTDRRYSGSFMVRTSPILHAKLMVEAAEQRVSLNQWVVQKLAARPMVSFDDY
ncbi:type II toxin-antitoxin system HicB family antitoxin, partial [Klebsiella pneumoniae]|nr:type II toxin-antitoxin system HicB family antitoxin [Klebsiella pneumoniae]